MGDIDELYSTIKAGKVPAEGLEKVVALADEQLSRYAGMQALLEAHADEAWTYAAYVQVWSIGVPEVEAQERWQWDQLSSLERAGVRADLLASVRDGQRLFGDLKGAVEAALAQHAYPASDLPQAAQLPSISASQVIQDTLRAADLLNEQRRQLQGVLQEQKAAAPKPRDGVLKRFLPWFLGGLGGLILISLIEGALPNTPFWGMVGFVGKFGCLLVWLIGALKTRRAVR